MSEDKVFESIETVHPTEDLMSFDGCPNRCRNGYYVDPYKHKRVRCEHCFELRKKLVKEQIQVDSGKSLGKTLRLRDNFMGYGNFDVDTVLHRTEIRKFEDWSVSFAKNVLQKIIDRVSIGEPVVPSMILNLGRRAHSQNFIAPFLVRSYISGLTTAPFLSGLDVQRLRMYPSPDSMPKGWQDMYADLSFDSILTPDTCLVYLDAGSDYNTVSAVKGLMQLRALNDKSTVILTDYYSNHLLDLIEDVADARVKHMVTNTAMQSVDAICSIVDGTVTSVKDLAVFVSVRYKKSLKAEDIAASGGSGDMSQADMQSLMSAQMSGTK